MLPVIRLFRPSNLLIIAITQLFALFFLNASRQAEYLLRNDVILLVLATVLVAAAGNLINDYFDIKTDQINKPSQVIIGKNISKKAALVLYILLTVTSVILSYFINIKILLIVFAVSALLLLYSAFLKQTPIIGNLLVSALTALTLFILLFLEENISNEGIYFFSSFAFLLSFFREIVKDVQDIKGDKKTGCKTLPVLLGIKTSTKILKYLLFAIIIFTISFSFGYASDLLSSKEVFEWFIIYILVAVVTPLIFIVFLLNLAKNNSDYKVISKITKFIMIAGIISMVFWKL